MIQPSRRRFLTGLPLAGLLPAALRAGETTQSPADADSILTFGFITDVHHGTYQKDQVARIRRFVSAATERRADFILQCGDFCCAKGGIEANRELLDEWRRFAGPRHHVIGNHDCDFQTKDELLGAWEIPARHYSFDAKGFHFVILDRNHFIDESGRMISYGKGNWYGVHRKGGAGHLARVSCIDAAQLEWLERDLAATDKPTILFQHQPSGCGSHEGNWAELNQVIDRHNARRGRVQAAAVFAGHDHDEVHAVRHGVHHLTLTSSTFGMPFEGNTTYYEEERPPFTFVTLDAGRGLLRIEEARSAYLDQPAMKPELAWINPPAIHSRELRLGGTVSV